jgi:hypothetical protein
MSTSNKKAGKASGAKRAALAKLRQLHVLIAHGRLETEHQDKPYSDHSLDELGKELRRSEQRRSALESLAKSVDPALSDDESPVEIIEDAAGVLHEARAAGGAKTISLEERKALSGDDMRRLPAEKLEAMQKHDALLDQVVGGLFPSQKGKKKKKRKTWSRDRLIKDLEALGKRSKRRSR